LPQVVTIDLDLALDRQDFRGWGELDFQRFVILELGVIK
jgi:hypothetical protein